MPRTCTVCSHDRRGDIEAAILEGVPNRRIASQYDVSERAIRHHKQNHLPARLMAAHEAAEVASADALLGQLRDLQSRTRSILEEAESSREHANALRAIREARSNLELLARLTERLDERPQVNILIAPQVEEAIVNALKPYPRASLAVAQALASVEEPPGG